MDTTYILFLYEQIDGGEIVSHVLGDDLRLDLVDPAVDVVDALLVYHVLVRLEQTLALRLRRLLQVVPLTSKLFQTWLDDVRKFWLLVLQSSALLKTSNIQHHPYALYSHHTVKQRQHEHIK